MSPYGIFHGRRSVSRYRATSQSAAEFLGLVPRAARSVLAHGHHPENKKFMSKNGRQFSRALEKSLVREDLYFK
jgi:hypothetical protein